MLAQRSQAGVAQPGSLARQPLDESSIKSGPQRREYDSICDRLAAGHPRSVLDWGCGHGYIAHRLIDRGLQVTAFDYQADIEADGRYSRPLFPDLPIFLSSDPVRLPFPDGSFDTVLSCGVLEHVSDPDASLDEINRVLSPGGAFLVYKLPNRFSYLEKIARLIGIYYHGAWPDDRVYTKRSAFDLLLRHGFRVAEFRRVNVLPLTFGPGSEVGSGLLWGLNRVLSRLPGLNLLATNLEFVAHKPA